MKLELKNWQFCMTTFFWPVCIIAGAACVPVSGAGCRLARPPALLAWQHWGQARILGLSWCLGKYKDARPAAGTSQCRQPAGDRERERRTENVTGNNHNTVISQQLSDRVMVTTWRRYVASVYIHANQVLYVICQSWRQNRDHFIPSIILPLPWWVLILRQSWDNPCFPK